MKFQGLRLKNPGQTNKVVRLWTDVFIPIMVGNDKNTLDNITFFGISLYYLGKSMTESQNNPQCVSLASPKNKSLFIVIHQTFFICPEVHLPA